MPVKLSKSMLSLKGNVTLFDRSKDSDAWGQSEYNPLSPGRDFSLLRGFQCLIRDIDYANKGVLVRCEERRDHLQYACFVHFSCQCNIKMTCI